MFRHCEPLAVKQSIFIFWIASRCVPVGLIVVMVFCNFYSRRWALNAHLQIVKESDERKVKIVTPSFPPCRSASRASSRALTPALVPLYD